MLLVVWLFVTVPELNIVILLESNYLISCVCFSYYIFDSGPAMNVKVSFKEKNLQDSSFVLWKQIMD